MYYKYNRIFGGFWQQMATMIEKNYETPENANDVMILGMYVHYSVSRIKEVLEAEGISYNKLIVYQSEPLVQNHWWKTEDLIENLKQFDEVWDYDLENVELLREFGIDAKFRPPVRTDALKTVMNCVNPDIDVLFYGSFTPYREKMMDDYMHRIPVTENDYVYGETSFIWAFNFCDKKLDEWIARSKIILNLNPYEGDTRQQQTRIFYALNNNKCVLSQASRVNYFGDSIVEFTDHQDMKNKLTYLLTNDTWRQYTNKHKYFTNPNSRSQIALFFNVTQLGDWRALYEYHVYKTQQSGLYDTADFIHVNVEAGVEPLPFALHKVNRVTYGDANYYIDSFKKSCPDYSVIKVNTINGTTSAV